MAAGERMNHREIFDRCRGNGNVRDARRRGQRGVEGERQMANRLAELWAMVAIPGVDRVKCLQRPRARAFDDTHQIDPGIRDRQHPIRKADQRKHRPGSPNLGVIGTRSLQLRQR